MAELTPDRLRALLDYDPATGIFTWKVKTSSRAMPGDIAGRRTTSDSIHFYRLIGIDKREYLAHWLAFLWMTGEWPAPFGQRRIVVDHRDGNGENNAWCNLRVVTQRVNLQNRRAPGRKNRSGALGVSRDALRNKWKAVIQIEGRQKQLGRFDDMEEAAAAYLAAKRLHHTGCTI